MSAEISDILPGRAPLLYAVADSYGFDAAMCHAMIHVETITDKLDSRGLTWDDVPESFPLEELLPDAAGPSDVGRVILELASFNKGLGKILVAYDEPERREPILRAYRQCLKVAKRGETLSYAGFALYQILTKDL